MFNPRHAQNANLPGGCAHCPGSSLLETAVYLVLLALFIGLILGLSRSLAHRERVRKPIRTLRLQIAYARNLATTRSVESGLFLDDRTTDAAAYRVCWDGNGNGIHRIEIKNHIDPCNPNVQPVGLPPEIPAALPPWPVPELPPKRGVLTGKAPLQWGANHAIVCNPWGICTSSRTFWTEQSSGTVWCLKFIGHLGRVDVWKYPKKGPWTRDRNE